MKKIAILTLHLGNNYGGLLQAYALNNYLRKLGYDAYTLDIKEDLPKIALKKRIASYCWRLFKRLKGDKSVYYLDVQKQMRIFRTTGHHQLLFIKNHIPTISIKFPIDKNFQKKYNFDAYIVGSDQVWRSAFVSNIKNYFLDFVPDEVTKISYAASFGTSKFEINENLINDCKILLSKFNAVSVREKDAINICKKMISKDIELLIDPTLLISKEQYISLSKRCISEKSNILLVYLLDVSKKNKKIVNKLASILNLKPMYVGELNNDNFPSIESWLTGFDISEFVVTDSFHGTLFSLIFNKPFVSISNEERGTSRFISILEKFDLKGRLINNIEDFENYNREKLLYTINFDKINRIIKQEQEKSQQFLTINLC